MAVLKCKMCGGDIELLTQKDFGQCEYCGSTMTFPKMDDEQRIAAFNKGNHFRRIGEFDKALSVYENIVNENGADAEAHWCCALCRFGIEYVKDPVTSERLPTCHKVSYDSFLEDYDYLAALENSSGETRNIYQRDGMKIAEVQRGILAMSRTAEPYDIFISYKEKDEYGERTVDSMLAQDIYYQLTSNGYRVFFSRISLENIVGSRYEPYIFAALNSAKVMIVIGTKPEYLNAVWVKNEWSRYLALVKKDRSRVILPCYRDMDPYQMPEQLSVLQAYDMSKIGFVQDLIRGIDKVLNREEKQTNSTENAGSGNSLATYIKRGYLALEDGEWGKAEAFFENALNVNAESGEAYFGKFLVSFGAHNPEQFMNTRLSAINGLQGVVREISVDSKRFNDICEKYYIKNYSNINEYRYMLSSCKSTYTVFLQSLIAARDEEQRLWDNEKNLSKAVRFASGEFKSMLDGIRSRIFDEYESRIKAAEENDKNNERKACAQVDGLVAEAERKMSALYAQASGKRENDYLKACDIQRRIASVADCNTAKQLFINLGDYKDSISRIGQCEELQQLLIAQNQVKEAEEQQERQAQSTEYYYQQSIKAMEAAKSSHRCNSAAEMFDRLGDYRDSKARAAECRSLAAEYKKREHKRRVKTGIGIGSGAVGLIVLVCVLLAVILPKTKQNDAYKNAETLFSEGNYEEAAAAFAALGDYKDAKEKYKEVRYAEAMKDMELECYDLAHEIFEQLGDYKDSKDKLILAENENDYKSAMYLLERKDYEKAKAAFEALGDFRDAKKYANSFAVRFVGVKVSGKDISEHTISCEYNENGELINMESDGENESATYRYAADGYYRIESASVRDTKTYIYATDGKGELKKKTEMYGWEPGDPVSDDLRSEYSYEYNADGTVAKRTESYYSEEEKQYEILTEYRYDSNGKKTEQKYVKRWISDSGDGPAVNKEVAFVYDESGMLESVTISSVFYTSEEPESEQETEAEEEETEENEEDEADEVTTQDEQDKESLSSTEYEFVYETVFAPDAPHDCDYYIGIVCEFLLY